jgi:hypothetical protein
MNTRVLLDLSSVVRKGLKRILKLHCHWCYVMMLRIYMWLVRRHVDMGDVINGIKFFFFEYRTICFVLIQD